MISVRSYCDAFFNTLSTRLAARSVTNGLTTFRMFYEHLGTKADQPIKDITRGDIKNFIAAKRERVRAKTVKKYMYFIGAAFADALDSEVIDRNPCAGVRVPADSSTEKLQKEAFTIDEIRYIIDKFPPQWSSAVRCSFETYGQRLGDILSLRWDQFDFEHRVVRIVTSKTGRMMVLPMRDSFYSWAISTWESLGKPEGYLHPVLRIMGDGASYQFSQLLRCHGIGTVQGSTEGDRKSRLTKTFHSIRSTCATLLQASGVSQGIAMQLVGHDSQEIHAAYLRPTDQQLREASSQLPEL